MNPRSKTVSLLLKLLALTGAVLILLFYTFFVLWGGTGWFIVGFIVSAGGVLALIVSAMSFRLHPRRDVIISELGSVVSFITAGVILFEVVKDSPENFGAPGVARFIVVPMIFLIPQIVAAYPKFLIRPSR
jgi:hypothetical protein